MKSDWFAIALEFAAAANNAGDLEDIAAELTRHNATQAQWAEFEKVKVQKLASWQPPAPPQKPKPPVQRGLFE